MDNNQTGFQVKPEERQTWVSIAMIWVGSMICVPCLMIGGMLGVGLSIPAIILCILVGYGIVCTYMSFMGCQACDTGLPTVSLASGALGSKGAQYMLSALLSIACIGWFGIQSAVCGASFSIMVEQMGGPSIPVWISAVIWGVIMLVTAIYGYNGLKILNYIAVPALVVVLAYAVYTVFANYDGANVLAAYVPAQPMPLVAGINMVVATFALAGVICADYCRYAKSRADVIKSSALGVIPAGFAMLLIGAVLTIITGEYDVSKVLSTVGVPVAGVIALILATWTTNVANAYSGGIAVASLFGMDESKFKFTAGVAGGLGIILAAVGILDKFQAFLGVLTAFIPPVAGVIMADYWIVGKGKAANFQIRQGVNWVGVISFAIGAAVAYVTANIVPFFVGPINGIVVCMAAYLAISKLMPAKAAKAQEAQ